MQSRLQDIMQPATTALLDAIDTTMNSNTMLFIVQSDQLITTDNAQAILYMFLQSSLFQDMFLEIDRIRQLLSYTIWNIVDDEPFSCPLSGSVVREQFHVLLTPMDKHSFAERLHWMLTNAFSPYGRHVSESRAQEVMMNFFWEIFTSESYPHEQSHAQRYWDEHPWSFYDVAPNFLHSTGYYHASEGYEPPDFAYFEGGEEDTCTFFYSKDIFYLLLTNGSP